MAQQTILNIKGQALHESTLVMVKVIDPGDLGVVARKRVNFEKCVAHRALCSRADANVTHPPLALLIQARIQMKALYVQVIQTAPKDRRPRQAHPSAIDAEHRFCVRVQGGHALKVQGGPNARRVRIQGVNVHLQAQCFAGLTLDGWAQDVNSRQNERMHHAENDQSQKPKGNAQPQQEATDGAHPAPKAQRAGCVVDFWWGHG